MDAPQEGWPRRWELFQQPLDSCQNLKEGPRHLRSSTARAGGGVLLPFQGSALAPATDPNVREWTQSECERRGHIRASPGSLHSGCQPRICSCERCPEPDPSQQQNEKHSDQASGTEGLSVFNAAGLGSGAGNERTELERERSTEEVVGRA